MIVSQSQSGFKVSVWKSVSETKKDVSFEPDETTELTEGKWKYKQDKKPRIDDLMVDLIEHLCRDYKRSDFKKSKCDEGCPDGLPVSKSSRRCKSYSIARYNFLKRHDGIYDPELDGEKFCRKRQLDPNQNNNNNWVGTAAVGTAAVNTASGYTWNAGDFSVRVTSLSMRFTLILLPGIYGPFGSKSEFFINSRIDSQLTN